MMDKIKKLTLLNGKVLVTKVMLASTYQFAYTQDDSYKMISHIKWRDKHDKYKNEHANLVDLLLKSYTKEEIIKAIKENPITYEMQRNICKELLGKGMTFEQLTEQLIERSFPNG